MAANLEATTVGIDIFKVAVLEQRLNVAYLLVFRDVQATWNLQKLDLF